MNDIYTEIWDKDINRQMKKSNVDGFDSIKKSIRDAVGVDESIKAEYIQKCEDAMDSILSAQEEEIMNDSEFIDVDPIESIVVDENSMGLDENLINADGVEVGEEARHVKMSKKKLAAIIGGGVALLAVAGATIYSCHSCSSSAVGLEETTTTMPTDEETNDEVVIPNTIKPTLSFDTEDTDVMIENLKGFVKGIIPNGIELTDAELEEQVESLINYYVWLNLNEIGPSYLSELYQTDSVSYIEIFSDSMYWANVLRFDSITSSAKDNTVVDLSMMISNKKDLELVQSFQNLNARLHDAVNANDVANINGIVSEYKTLIETKLLDHVSYSYGQGAMDLCFRLVYSGEQLLADYDVVIMDDSLSKIINEDTFLKCIQSISISTIEDKTYTKQEIEQTIQVNTSKKSDNVIYQIDLLKDYMSRLNMQLDFTGKKSVADVMIEVSSYVRENNLLSTYKENESLEVFFARVYDQTHVPKDTIQPGDVIISDNTFIEKEELDKHNIDTSNKTSEQVEKEYQEAVREEIESSLESEKTFTDNQGNVLETGSNAEDYAADYAKGYTEGSKQGAIDGNALAAENSVVSGSKGYVAGYAVGYKASYAEARQQRLNAEKDTSVTIETVKPTEQSSEVINSGTLKQPETTTKQLETTTKQPETTTKQIETTAPVVKEEETTTGIIEEEVIEEGILTPQYAEVTLSRDELYSIYYEVLYGSSNNSLEEETTYSKTR